MTSGADAIVSEDDHLLRVRARLGILVYEPRDLVRLGIV